MCREVVSRCSYRLEGQALRGWAAASGEYVVVDRNAFQAVANWLVSFLPADLWKGAVLGAVVSGVFVATASQAKRLLRRSPIKALLGGLATDEGRPAFYVRSMFTQDNKFMSKEPQILPNGPTQIQISAWQNIPEVVALADVAAASDMAGLLADAGVRAAIEFRSLEKDWDRWTEPLVSIGGHFKTYRLLEVLEPKVVEYVPVRFRVLKTGQELVARDGNDYGLIVRAPHPVTGATCLVVMGLGALGTEAAARFLRTNALVLGRALGRAPLTIVVRAALGHGREAAVPVCIAPSPSWARRCMCPLACKRLSRLLRPVTA